MDTVDPTELAQQIAKRLTAMRLQKAWTRDMLAHQSGVNVHTLKHFERTGQISLERLISIAVALDAESDIIKLFKPRQRVNVDNWEVDVQPQRQRGKRNAVLMDELKRIADTTIEAVE